MKGRSTIGAIVSFIERVLEDLDENKFCLATFLDLTNAFDCVDRELLLKKLERYGIRGTPLNLLSSYLNNRFQFVCLPDRSAFPNRTSLFTGITPNHFTSPLTIIKYGVPQGSILGPLLFLVYVNSLVKDNIMYADDTTCISVHRSLEQLEIDANIQINVLTQELATHKLLVNSKKTNSILFQPKRKSLDFEPTLNIDYCPVINCSGARFLGLHVDSDLKWSSHVDVIIGKICSGLFVLRNISKLCSKNLLLLVYFALVQSHISYGIALWGACSVYKMESILKLQKRAIRYICGLPRDSHCRPLFKDLKILTAPSLYIFEVCLLTKKNANSLRRLGDTHTYETRHKNKFEVPPHRTCRYELKPSYQGIKFYEALPNIIRMEENFIKFKSSLKKYLIDKSYYKVNELFE